MAKSSLESRNSSSRPSDENDGSTGRMSRSKLAHDGVSKSSGPAQLKKSPSKASEDEKELKQHRKCLAILAKAETDGEKLKDWIKAYREETSDTIQQLRKENVEEQEKAGQLASARDKALFRIQEQDTEIGNLKQKLAAVTDDSLAYKSIQPVLVKMQDKVQSALNEIGTTIDTYNKKNLCMELPGTESYSWTAPNPNYAMMDSGLFHNNYNMPMGNATFNPQQQQQIPVQTNLYGQSG